MKLYRIKDWERRYENNRTRELKKLDWVPVSNKHDGEGFCRVMAHPKAAEIYTAFHLMLQVASRCNPRGTLVRDDGRPLTPDSLAIKTRSNPKWFTQAIEFLSQPDIGWVEVLEVPDSEVSAGRRDDVATGCDNPASTCGDLATGCVEGKGREGNRSEEKPNAAKAAPLTDEQWLEGLKANPTYQGIDVAKEYGKMVEWCKVRGRRPTRRTFINWINGADKPMSATGQPALPLFLQIKSLEEQIAKHPANYESIHYKHNYTEEQLAEYKSLLARLNQLKTTPND